MDSLPHALQKILIERATSNTLPTPTQTPTTDAPPAYSAHPDDCDDETEDPDPVSLVLNAATTVRGSDNIVSLLSSPLADATRFSALLLAAVQRLNAVAEEVSIEGKCRPILRVNLTINAGLHVLGNRNVVGNAPVKRSVPLQMSGGNEMMVVGKKRSAEDENKDNEDEAKRLKTE
ncbi:hypothetical protein MBLNU457_5695t1 [Dothideomycetes sp. NU457]